MKRNKGITLLSLIITVIILIILSLVTINLILGKEGILNRTEEAKNENLRQTATEKMNLKITNIQIGKYAEEQRMPTLQEFSDGLCEDNEIQYVELKSQKIASLSKIEVGNAESIFTKLKDYPYEFEINSSLQLASVDGIKIATNESNTEVSQPTGIKFDTYICNKKDTTSIYSLVTCMTGFTRTTDDENKISKYLDYSDTNGYEVLKSGWYFVKTNVTTVSNGNPTDTTLYFNINDNAIGCSRTWATGVNTDCDLNSFSLYLEKGDKIYYSASATGVAAKKRDITAYLYPMF